MNIFIKVLFVRSAISFCCEVLGNYQVSQDIFSPTEAMNSSEQNSNLLFVCRHSYFSIYFSIIVFHPLKVPNTSLFCFKKNSETFLRNHQLQLTSISTSFNRYSRVSSKFWMYIFKCSLRVVFSFNESNYFLFCQRHNCWSSSYQEVPSYSTLSYHSHSYALATYAKVL